MPSGVYKHKKGYKRPPYSEEWKRKISIGKKKNPTRYWLGRTDKKGVKGDKNSFWKGGITPILIKIRQSKEYKLWRKSVWERDNFTCIWCGTKENIQADHIKPFSLFPELRFSIDNGRTLCLTCHRTTSTYGGRINKFNIT